MDWKWACKICNTVFDDTNSLIQHYLKEHRAGINYGVPIPVDLIPPLKEQAKAKLKPKRYEPAEAEEEEPEEAEEEEVVEDYKPKKKPKEDDGFDDLRLE